MWNNFAWDVEKSNQTIWIGFSTHTQCRSIVQRTKLGYRGWLYWGHEFSPKLYDMVRDLPMCLSSICKFLMYEWILLYFRNIPRKQASFLQLVIKYCRLQFIAVYCSIFKKHVDWRSNFILNETRDTAVTHAHVINWCGNWRMRMYNRLVINQT